MNTHRLTQALAFAGVAGLVYFWLLSPNNSGVVGSVALMIASSIVQYSSDRPFILPLYAWLAGILLVLQILRGEFLAALLGTVLGLGLPYMHYRINQSRFFHR
ncbi:conserved hypothetical protein [Allomeiothermus silvanus DSM 9946]|uniref:Uncharacterized protein n=1 Tax=Allomeiothermus silvanus (strain ATCC 700542 / DSM 9946 / NBRC 106475 / NCIMB 13440 / VI-R2) TaxID=526227 RepID=D7BEK7_ALLS1|nr:hypothetical protein [Allomeiothermus silvanus]ADH63250.1 conserved hypothetical protein [Allomeiothermus silvanus DSM 9946]